MKRATDEQLLIELETDSTDLGYKNVDGSWKNASQIGHLLSIGSPCRATVLWDGGAIDLKRIAKIVYGDDWLCKMFQDDEITYEEIKSLHISKRISDKEFEKVVVLHCDITDLNASRGIGRGT